MINLFEQQNDVVFMKSVSRVDEFLATIASMATDRIKLLKKTPTL